MKIITQYGWTFYLGDTTEFNRNKVGKWMYYFNNKGFASEICAQAVETGIVREAKHSDDETGVCCFYLNCDDRETHNKVLTFFLDNNLIRKTKVGKLYNISFKLDNQTRAGEYGKEFHSDITLSNFINLETGEWL